MVDGAPIGGKPSHFWKKIRENKLLGFLIEMQLLERIVMFPGMFSRWSRNGNILFQYLAGIVFILFTLQNKPNLMQKFSPHFCIKSFVGCILKCEFFLRKWDFNFLSKKTWSERAEIWLRLIFAQKLRISWNLKNPISIISSRRHNEKTFILF